MKTHATFEPGVLCGRQWRLRSVAQANVDCKRCLRLLAELAATAERVEAEQRQEATYSNTCEALGVSHIWDALGTETPTDRLMRGVFGAVILGLHEAGAVERGAAA